MPVAYGESERLLGKVFSLAGDNLEAIVQRDPFSILKPWILIQIESFHNSMSRRPSLRTHNGALETRGNFHFFTFSICSTKLPFRDPCSLVAKEKASSSDNENSPATKGGEFQKRICDKGTMKEKRGKPVVASDRPGKGDRLHKHNIHHSDGAKYMS
ncbi:hypothetical protein NC653_026943 [Populus alba x Populus x berolinensis]|uniref:Uncharacterized protein n=1 Tax=Populus alba x Populus x berolinensis TaxID=444605 RepID=A0AAD6Q458_9ROSI|nr:hypothetical protein NC653_026943 [Populus alba x Populus x berolinensis]